MEASHPETGTTAAQGSAQGLLGTSVRTGMGSDRENDCECIADLGPCDCNERDLGGYLHWQIVVVFARKIRLSGVREVFGTFHAEATRSAAALEYVWKDQTSVDGTRFELGTLPHNRGNDIDWARIRSAATEGRMGDIPDDVYVRNYHSLKRIHQDHLEPKAIIREVRVYWGKTGVGKSRRAWDEATFNAFPKDPRTKFWDGYRSHKNVVIDEFRGDIDIAHVLRWFDRYPVIVEVKGTSVVLEAETIWITSNLHPDQWYPDLDQDTRDAFMRRLNIEEIVGTQ